MKFRSDLYRQYLTKEMVLVMAYKRVILDSADSDRSAIVEQLIAATGGKRAASSFMDDVDIVVNLIAEFPTVFSLSRFAELARLGYRMAPVNNYLFLYAIEDGVVAVARFFYQTQNYASLV